MLSVGNGWQSFLFLALLLWASLLSPQSPQVGWWMGKGEAVGETGTFLLAVCGLMFSHPSGCLKLMISLGALFWVRWRHLFWAIHCSSRGVGWPICCVSSGSLWHSNSFAPRLWECWLILTQPPLDCCCGLLWPLRLVPLSGTHCPPHCREHTPDSGCGSLGMVLEALTCFFLFCRAGTYSMAQYSPHHT